MGPVIGRERRECLYRDCDWRRRKRGRQRGKAEGENIDKDRETERERGREGRREEKRRTGEYMEVVIDR